MGICTELQTIQEGRDIKKCARLLIIWDILQEFTWRTSFHLPGSVDTDEYLVEYPVSPVLVASLPPEHREFFPMPPQPPSYREVQSAPPEDSSSSAQPSTGIWCQMEDCEKDVEHRQSTAAHGSEGSLVSLISTFPEPAAACSSSSHSYMEFRTLQPAAPSVSATRQQAYAETRKDSPVSLISVPLEPQPLQHSAEAPFSRGQPAANAWADSEEHASEDKRAAPHAQLQVAPDPGLLPSVALTLDAPQLQSTRVPLTREDSSFCSPLHAADLPGAAFGSDDEQSDEDFLV